MDDEPSLIFLAEEILTGFGYTVLTTVDGETALEFYHRDKERIDLMILDLIMPGIGRKRFFEEPPGMDPQATATAQGDPGCAGQCLTERHDVLDEVLT